MRGNLIQVGESDEERPSLATTAGEIVSDLRKRLRLIRNEEPDVENEKRLLALGNTIAKVLESARKLQADGVDAVNQMSFAERAELFVAWYCALPPTYRESLRDKMTDYELAIAKPIAELTSGV